MLLQGLVKLLLTLPIWLLFRPRIIGWKHLFFTGPAIIAANHFSLTDPAFIMLTSPRIIRYLAKPELFEKPMSRMLMTALGAFPVQREHMEITSIRHAIRVLEGGGVFGIFPEGRRSLTGELDAFDKGAAFLALRCHVPIIPVYADPTAQKRLRVRMIVGKPMDADAIAAQYKGRAVDTVTLALRDRIMDLKNIFEGRG